jgi:regulator of sigma E protease
MDFVIGVIVPFLVVLTIVVFFHELGHFWVARRCGVRVEVFSIGFGPELLGFTDRTGTRWRVSALPFGGYVKMFGQTEQIVDQSGSEREMTAAEKAVSFHHKSIPQRVAIVAAGPIANFILAILVFIWLFSTQEFISNVVGGVPAGSGAEAAGIRAGDRIIEMNGWSIRQFDHIAMEVQVNGDRPMEITIIRDGREITLTAQPKLVTVEDDKGEKREIYRLGIEPSGQDIVRYAFPQAITYAAEDTFRFTIFTLRYLGKMVIGERPSADLGGPLRIAEVASEAAKIGVTPLIDLIAKLSISLGLLNLFPIPLLDGGHIVFYAIEALRGRPLGERAQEMGMRIGIALVLGLMIFATWNDLVHLKVFDLLRNLVT